jgi:zinc/manganese transport system ATP-binding protein
VLNVRGRVVVVGTPDEPGGCHHHDLAPETAAEARGGAA